MKAIDAKAFAIVDACTNQLRELGGGEIPVRWQQHFAQVAREAKKPELNQLHIQITAEYLNECSKSNPALPEPASDLFAIPDEEPAPRGSLQKLADKHGMHHSSVREPIKKTLERHRIDAMSEAIILTWDE